MHDIALLLVRFVEMLKVVFSTLKWYHSVQNGRFSRKDKFENQEIGKFKDNYGILKFVHMKLSPSEIEQSFLNI